jgi:hypothetical protein
MGYKYVPTTQMMLKYVHMNKNSANSLRSTKSVSVYVSRKSNQFNAQNFVHNTILTLYLQRS